MARKGKDEQTHECSSELGGSPIEGICVTSMLIWVGDTLSRKDLWGM